MFVIAGYPQGGSVFCNLEVFLFYMYIRNVSQFILWRDVYTNKVSVIFLACPVKKAGYSVQPLFSAFLWTERRSRSKETQKGTRPISDNINRTKLDVKGVLF